MKIGITGIEGSIALKLADRLREKGHDIVGCDIKADGRNGDFTRREVAEALAKKSDVCVHSGAVANLNYARKHPLKAVRTNVYGTGVVADACSKFGVPLLYISTCCVYGNTSEFPTSETAEKDPTEIYAYTKLAGEEVVKGYGEARGLPWSILRLGTVYGPKTRKAMAVNIFLEKALNGDPLPIHGTGEQTRSWIYIDDLVEALSEAVSSPVIGKTINVAGKESLSVLEMALKCIEVCSSDSVLDYVEDRKGQVEREDVDISKAGELLGWKPSTPLEEGLRETANWLALENFYD